MAGNRLPFPRRNARDRERGFASPRRHAEGNASSAGSTKDGQPTANCRRMRKPTWRKPAALPPNWSSFMPPGRSRMPRTPQANFYARLLSGLKASFIAVHFYPHYAGTRDMRRRLTWNAAAAKWVDKSEPGFACGPATMPSLPSPPRMEAEPPVTAKPNAHGFCASRRR